MAIRASLTGHLVMSTIHTNSAWGIISRLVDMGIPNYLIADTLNAAVAQRLVRLLCNDCKEEIPFDHSLFPKSYKSPTSVENHCIPKGCDTCFYTGYRGRSAVYEIIPMDFELQTMIKNNEYNVQGLLKERNIKTLADNAFKLFYSGKTSIDEVYSILSS